MLIRTTRRKHDETLSIRSDSYYPARLLNLSKGEYRSGSSRQFAVFNPMTSRFGQSRRVSQVEFFFEAFAIGFDRFWADLERLGDFAIAATRADQLKHLELAIGQFGEIGRRGGGIGKKVVKSASGDLSADENFAFKHSQDAGQNGFGGFGFHDVATGAHA